MTEKKQPRVDKKWRQWEWWWRPTKYKEEYCEQIIDYFERCQAEIMVDVKFFQPNKNATISTILNPLNEEETLEAGNVREIAQKLVMQRFPTYVRFARSIGVSKSTLFEWSTEYKKFSDSMDICKDISEAILLENGLQWLYNPAFAQFLLKNNYWYKDQSEVKSQVNVWLGDMTDKQKEAILSLSSIC